MRGKTKLQKDKKSNERLANIENNILKGQTYCGENIVVQRNTPFSGLKYGKSPIPPPRREC